MTDLPSYKLVQRLMHESGFPVADPNDEMVFPEAKFMKLASRLIQYGADQELEACIEWVSIQLNCTSQEHCVPHLRAARRPQPPTLNEQALEDLRIIELLLEEHKMVACTFNIRRALEAL
jgi:hypothetical protein